MNNNLFTEKLRQPEALEQAFRESPQEFENQLVEALALNEESETLRVWHARLFYERSVAQAHKQFSIPVLVLLAVVAWLVVKLPALVALDGDWYYPRVAPLAVITTVVFYFFLTRPYKPIRLAVSIGLCACLGYSLFLPDLRRSASVIMALIHLPYLLLSLLGLSFMAERWKEAEQRIAFIRYLGELVIYAVLILLGGGVLTGITLGLFQLIGLDINQWYMAYVVVLGVVATPLVATYLFDCVLAGKSKFATILSNVFSPLFLITVLAYLLATLAQGKSPYSDREFLIIFNGLLLIILAVSVFSISGKTDGQRIVLGDYFNVALLIVTLLVNMIALSAIVFRWAEYGMTVNRVVVTGANLLIFSHLFLILVAYLKYLRARCGLLALNKVVARFLPVYSFWSLFVVLVLPGAFGFA